MNPDLATHPEQGSAAAAVTRAGPGPRQRLAATVALVLFAMVLALSIHGLFDEVRLIVLHTPLLIAALCAAWFALTRASRWRVVGVVICAIATVTGFVVVLVEPEEVRLSILVRLGLLLVAVPLARYSLGLDGRSLEAAPTTGSAVAAARNGVLIMNLKSGGGKAERFHLVDECRRRGIEAVALQPGDDLSELAQAAIDRGADVLGMAGGDGSQALVAAVAAAKAALKGDWGNLALDLGLDRDDVVGALDAFGEAVERRMDLGRVNGRTFVNNVSLGIYAEVIRSPEYRDAKVDTTLATIPRVFGPGAHPYDLHFRSPDGHHHGARLIQVSNNPYGAENVRGRSSRPSLGTGRLGIVTLEVTDDRHASQLLTAIAVRRLERFEGFHSWTATAFDVDSNGPVDAGLDGESLQLDAPLHFSIDHGALRVRLPRHASGRSPAARAMTTKRLGRAVWRTARGKDWDVESWTT